MQKKSCKKLSANVLSKILHKYYSIFSNISQIILIKTGIEFSDNFLAIYTKIYLKLFFIFMWFSKKLIRNVLSPDLLYVIFVQK